MNTKNNARSRETDERIAKAFYCIMLDEKKPISKITVREICELSQINRSTFYAHYTDVYDLLEKMEKNMAEKLTEAFVERLKHFTSLFDCFEGMFEFIMEYREFYSVYLNETNKSGAIGIAWEMLSDRKSRMDITELGFESQEELEYHSVFFLYGLTAVIKKWVNGGCKESPSKMREYLERQYLYLF